MTNDRLAVWRVTQLTIPYYYMIFDLRLGIIKNSNTWLLAALFVVY